MSRGVYKRNDKHFKILDKARKRSAMVRRNKPSWNRGLTKKDYPQLSGGKLTGYKHTEKSKEKMRISANRPETKRKKRVARLKQIFPQKDTLLEKKVQKALKKEGVFFETHVPLIGQPDIFIPPNICIFIDGCWWHNCLICHSNGGFHPERNIDKKVTKQLRKENYIVIRLWEHEINNNLEECIDRINIVTPVEIEPLRPLIVVAASSIVEAGSPQALAVG